MQKELKTRELRASSPMARPIDNCSFEMTSRDVGALGEATEFMRPGAEIFVANTPSDTLDRMVDAAVQVRRAAFIPVPHIVARNIASEGALSDALARLSGEAGVDRVLLLGGDRDQPAGPFGAALEVLRTGLLEKHAIRGAAFACYPERHPRIADDVLRQALVDKLTAARQAGIAASLVSQFAFDPAPIVEMARKLRSEGVTAPLRIGLAGPVNHAKLLRYALRSGVGPSLRILRDRKDLAFNLLAGETPDALVDEISAAQAAEPMLGISGIHLFTFGALPKSAQWARGKQRA